ncbi:hypothetical protein Cni_G11844 [Canna indica]|uniref:Uncharacterized protein n=1 Tax=Canna indica TaxID=4628 RepID=A0AAQ3K8E7_9LILI|nr:hypothetical protein Cni_G11844 [Canna indica]
MCISSALIFGYWGRNRALSECVDQIITIDGSRIQNELATIILSKHENNTSLMKLVSKHYYSEWVYNDLNQDKPILRWRPRDAYGDNTDAFKKTELENSSNDNKRNVYVDSTVASKKIELENSSNGNKRNICPNQSTVSTLPR